PANSTVSTFFSPPSPTIRILGAPTVQPSRGSRLECTPVEQGIVGFIIGNPTRRVLAVCGDGGVMMDPAELGAPGRLQPQLVLIILQDNAYGMIRWKHAADGYPDFGMTFGNPHFVVYAKSYGIKGARVESADGLVPALEAAFAAGGVQLVAALIDYSENLRVL